ncbi:class I SAM-dependent methyltransferase [candidate division CSSED10-310 bacterium]|uniref:Class I SAM-dependent methyltransferase n=1 Tax=candidate division CSSED10-310 bacterium TaxID=2855610 RepID=A0ABV6YYZ3_UNCC1
MSQIDEDIRVGEIVSAFYNKYPFPGYDAHKYVTQEDLFKNANLYSRLLDNQIPWEKTVLDAGCGTGQLACLLSIKDRKTLGIDFSEESLSKGQKIKEKLKLNNLTFRRADLLDLKAGDERYDYIFCNGVLHHTNNPYLGFQNIIQFATSGTFIVIGLYNRYGRLRLRIKRRWINWKYRSNIEKTRDAIQEMLVKDEKDTEKQDTWYQDQYQHPHELSHTIDELLGWFKKHNIEYINSLPPIELFRKEENATRIFKKSPVTGWRNSQFGHLLKQLKWIISLRKTGGYFMIVGKKL